VEVHRMEFDDLYEAVMVGDDAIKLGKWKGSTLSDMASREIKPHGWAGTKTWEEAKKLALEGWDEGVERLSDLRDQLMDDLTRELPVPTLLLDVEGFTPDVGSFVAGVPEDMLNWRDLPGSSKQLHVVMNVAVNHNVSTDAMMLRGLLAAGLVDALEHMGHRVKLDVVSLTQRDIYGAFIVHMKSENQVLDLERLVFACAHPAMLRRIEFAVLEAQDAKTRNLLGVPNRGYGMASNEIRILDEHERGDIYIGTTIAPSSMLAVYDEVLGYLRKAGVIATEEES
jgi:hypothetical protein